MRDILEKEYSKLEKEDYSPTGKVNLLNNIVQFKLIESEFQNYKNDLSVDIKRYLNSLIELAENGARKYDIIIEDKISFLKDVNYFDRINYLNYFIRILEKSAFKDDIKELQKLKYKYILKHSWANFWRLRSILNIFVYFPIYSVYTLIITLLIITVITNIILLPAPVDFMAVLNYKIEYLHISENSLINHFMNVSSGLIGINQKFSITPLDSVSMITLILAKVFFFAYVVTLIFNKLTDLIKR